MKFLLLALLLAAAASAEPRDPSVPRSEIFALQYGAGLVGAGAGAGVGALIGASLNCRSGHDDWCGISGLVAGGLIGYAAGQVAGISFMGKAFYGNGYWIATALGAVAGTAGALLVSEHMGSASWVPWVIAPALPTLSYHLARDVDMRVSALPGGASLRMRKSF